MTKRTSVSISAKSLEQLRAMQADLERSIGFEPSLAQIVEHLIKEYAAKTQDTMTSSQTVATN
jgi:hypothetical protein